MTMLQRLCGLGIVLALISVRHSCSTNVSTEEPYQQYDSKSQAKYDVVDVAKQRVAGNDYKAQPGEEGGRERGEGQTTRIFTTGDVDEQFWLRHLGEEFKNAIHLQVGESAQDDGVYNMTEDGTRYQIHHEYLTNENPVRDMKPKQANDEVNYPTKPIYEMPNFTSTTTNISSSSSLIETPQNEGNQYEVVIKKQTPEIATATETTEIDNEQPKSETTNSPTIENFEQSKDRIFTIANGKKSSRKYSKANTYDKESNAKPRKSKYSKSRNKLIKTTDRSDVSSNSKSNSNSKSHHPKAIVVNLPDNQKTIHQLNEGEMPVVVKMPPVIYHGRQSYEEDDTPDHAQTHLPQHQHSLHQTQEQTQPQTHSHQYSQQHSLQHSHQHSHLPLHLQYPHAYTQQYQHQHQNQHIHNIPDVIDTTNTQYNEYPQTPYSPFLSSYYQQPQPQQQQPQQPHSTYNDHSYGNENFYHHPPHHHQQSQQLPSLNTNEPASKLRYIISKRASSPPSSQDVPHLEPAVPTTSSSSDFNRVSRSNQDLFDQGL